MLDEATLALAASVGTAVAQAAGTDAWAAFRARLARTLGRGDAEREAAQGERLDRTADDVTAGRGEGADAIWRTRIEDLLEDLAPPERAALKAQLKALVGEFTGANGYLFLGDAAIQNGNGNIQVNRFGPRP
ncbi:MULTISPECIES: hypothetical protein [unclassified Streptomyces]|uniref:hypothetical protein n=1 Tax=unclassified Streptomyces TaxID=2593676 RepID=UPI000DD52DE3|nr:MULTISPECIES: hypothetical protein [unclassified Streptomyces]QZZ28996.1 hypothetical protein A7X85_24510 [Streptomyces sp. ST1015]